MSHACATRSGANGSSHMAICSISSSNDKAVVCGGPSLSRVCATAARKAASPDGRMAICSLARSAVSVRRGSNTTTRPPRSRSFCIRPIKPGATIMLPLDSAGLAPITHNNWLRSMSGMLSENSSPNKRPDTTWRGFWSRLPAVKKLVEPSALTSSSKYITMVRLWARALPT